MQHDQAAEAAPGDAAAPAGVPRAVTNVAQLMEVVAAARSAKSSRRNARALELFERALSAAEALLPPDSLITAALLELVVGARGYAHAEAGGSLYAGGAGFASQDAGRAALADAATGALQLARRALALLHERWRADTLLAPTPDERTFFARFGSGGDVRLDDSPAAREQCVIMSGADCFIHAAADAVTLWPPLPAPADDAARLRAVCGALHAAVDMFDDRRSTATPLRLSHVTIAQLHALLTAALSTAPPDGLLPRLRAVEEIGLSEELVGLLRGIAGIVRQQMGTNARLTAQRAAAERALAAREVARHGLRACAAPECGQQEAAPRTHKLCSRCRTAAYCCAEHQRADWRRHKREDGCQQAAA
jgi:hypothetical protein